jgi:hypothetical protein
VDSESPARGALFGETVLARETGDRLVALWRSGLKRLPHKGPRSREIDILARRRSPRVGKMREVEIPEIAVKVLDKCWKGFRWAEAKIRVRRGCYRYLAWRDGLFKREFYLGKVKNLTPQFSRGARARSTAAGELQDDIAGVQK